MLHFAFVDVQVLVCSIVVSCVECLILCYSLVILNIPGGMCLHISLMLLGLLLKKRFPSLASPGLQQQQPPG